LRELTTRNWGVSMERRVKEINRFTVGWTAYFALADTVLPFEKLDKWLAPQAQAGALERSGSAHKTRYRKPARARYLRPGCPQLGSLAERVLARRWVLATPTSTAERLLAPDHGPERVHRSLPTFSGNAERTARCGPACRVVWEGARGEPGSYPILRGGQPEDGVDLRPDPTEGLSLPQPSSAPRFRPGLSLKCPPEQGF